MVNRDTVSTIGLPGDVVPTDFPKSSFLGTAFFACRPMFCLPAFHFQTPVTTFVEFIFKYLLEISRLKFKTGIFQQPWVCSLKSDIRFIAKPILLSVVFVISISL